MNKDVLPTPSIRELEKMLRDKTIYDNLVMRTVFSDPENYPMLEKLINLVVKDIFPERKIEIKSVSIEHPIKLSVPSKDISMDVLAIDSDGMRFDLEVQKKPSDMSVKRIRFYSAASDYEILFVSQNYEDLKDSVMIVLCKKDLYGKGEPYYTLNRRVIGRSGKDYGNANDGSIIIIVNGEYHGDDDLGRFLVDLLKPNPDDIKDPLIKRAMVRLKKEEKGMTSWFYEMSESEKKKIEKAAAESFNAGLSQGLSQGLSEGIKISNSDIIKRLYKDNKEIAFISYVLNLGEEEIKDILRSEGLI